MLWLSIEVTTKKNIACMFKFYDVSRPQSGEQDGVSVELGNECPYEVRIVPPPADSIKSVSYHVSTNLKNFHDVIIPDTGRSYITQMRPVTFWGQTWRSRINNIRMPVFILTGMNHCTNLVFGIIGANIETDFTVREPATRRALIAWMKRLTLEIKRGTQDYSIPQDVSLSEEDKAFTEYLYFKEADVVGDEESWVTSLRKFSAVMADKIKVSPKTTQDSLLPYWCSWTDWNSNDVTSEVILDNVRQGIDLGIKNYIIDDGWFGPGLDNDFDVKLNIGDWSEDKHKIPDLRQLVAQIHAHNANAIIWCAPHAVSCYAKCFVKRKPYLIQNEKHELMMTSNGFHGLCFMCPEAREIMAEICADLVKKYDIDGAKYDLFNCVPDGPCVSDEHKHDTTSMIEGLARALELIERKTRSLKKEYIVELKQNYATPYLYEYGTIVRAGDTPYDPEGNFLRTAYINSYTPYSLNDYQTITNSDSVADAAVIVVKMLAVGVPSYSMDLQTLDERHKHVISFYHGWYLRNLDTLKNCRTPLDAQLGVWLARGNNKNIYFLVNNTSRLELKESRDSEIVNGTYGDSIYLKFPEEVCMAVEIDNFDKQHYIRQSYEKVRTVELCLYPGDIIRLVFEQHVV
ncbi:MAG: alpha-galactosidase [Planctomycetota bacterium]